MTITENGHASGHDRMPPHDIGAEQGALGGMLLHKDAIADVAGVIGAEDYYRPAHQMIHDAIIALYEQGEPADPVTVAALLAKRGELGRAGNADYLHTLIASVPTYAFAGAHARVVRDKAVLRRLVEEGTRIVQIAYEGEGEPAELAERARQAIDTVTARTASTELRSMGVLFAEVAGALEQEAERGLPTGFIDLDSLVNGFAPGEFIIVAARPGIGKSVLVTGMAAHTAMTSGHPVLLSSLEMSAEEITLRIISAEARVPLHALVSRQVGERDWDRIAKVSERISNSPLVIDDAPGATLGHIRGRLREMSRTAPARLLVVDYLGLLTAPKAENRQSEVAALSRGLKLIAREFGIPVIAAAQLNRGPEHRTDKRPVMSDLRESGAQEQDADVIILLHRDDAYNRESPRAGEIDLDVAKNRQGPKATVTAAFQGHYARVVDMAPEPWSPSAQASDAA